MRTRFFNWLLPQWAKNPLLNYDTIDAGAHRELRGYVMQLLALAILLALTSLIFLSRTSAIGNSRNFIDVVWQSLYFPTLTLQVLTTVVAFSLGATTSNAQHHSEHWDNLRLTEVGAGLALRARWLNIMLRLRAPITIILLVRLVLTLAMLSELTAFSGHYLRILSAGSAASTAELPAIVLWVAVSVAACVLLPLLNIASAAALGIVLAIAIKERLYATVVQVVIVAGVIVFVVASSFVVSRVLAGELPIPDFALSLLVFSYSAYGDWGLLFLQLDSLGAVWQLLPTGAFATLGLALLTATQAFIADGLMTVAVRLAERQS